MKLRNSMSVYRRRVFLPCGAIGAASAIVILTGPIQAQVIPPQATTRTWDNGAGATDLTWANPVNWSADTLPGIDDIANFNLGPATQQNINLGGVSREIGSLFFSANGASFYNLQNGTIVTNSINQNNADPNVLDPTALLTTKNSGADVLNVSVSSDTLGLQGMITTGAINKFGGGTLRLGTSGTAFNNVINGDITIYGGTLTAAANATSGSNNPLAGTGSVVIGNPNVTLSLTANGSLATNAEYDFVRDIRAGNNNFNLDVRLAGGTDTTDPNMRAGTLFIGTATMTVNQANGFRAALDKIEIAAGSTATRIQANALTFIDGLSGDANSNLFKRGGSDVEIRGDNAANFSGDIYNAEGNLRFLSTGAGLNPAGGSDSTIFFANGYGVTAVDGGQTIQLRSDASLDYGSNIAFRPGVTIGRVNVDRVGTSATNQTLSLGDVNISGKMFRIQGANGYILGLDTVTVDAGATANFDTEGGNALISGNLALAAGSTFNKLGSSTLTLSTDNSATALGTIRLLAGTITATAAGSLGTLPVTVGNTTPSSTGFLLGFSRLNFNASGASANATGADVIVQALGAADLNTTPVATDVFDIRSDGRIQGNAAQLAGLTVGTNLILAPDAIVMHEEPGAATGTVAGLANTPTVFYGIANTANSVPTIGAGTPWKGISGDNSARQIIGTVGVPAAININGGDNDPLTIEATFQSMNDVNLDFGSATLAETYTFNSTVAGQKVTLAIRGVNGANGSLGLTTGGRVVFRDDATTTGLSTAVDKIIVQGGTFSVGTVNGLGGVPVDVLNNGGLDIGGIAGDILDGNVAIKSGGTLILNDAQVLGGTGTITIEGGGRLDLSGSAPANIFSGSTQAINFTGTGHTVRFAASEIIDLDTKVPNAGVTYVVAGGATAAILGQSNLSVTTNTQTTGITLENGILTNDGASRGFTGPINLNNTNFTVAATRGTSLGVLNGIATTGSVQVGSNTAIDFRDKTQNPDRVSGLGLFDPHNGHSQVLFLGPVDVDGSMTAANGTRLGFADANTNILGDLTFNGTVLYLDGGGELSGGSATKGGLTARLTSTTGLAADRVANTIIMGDYSRAEMSIAVGSGTQTITQPFVITGRVNPLDKRTFWVDRAEAAGTVNAVFTDITLKNNAQFGIDESNVGVRASLKLEGNATLVRNHDDYDLRDITKAAGAPANVTLFAGEPSFGWDDATDFLVNGSNAALVSSVDGTVESGVTIDLIRGQLFFEPSAVLNGVVRAQTAVNRGDAFVVSRSNGATTNTTFNGTGEIQLGRSVAANGPEDFDIRATEVATGNPAQQHTVAVPVRVVDDGSLNIDGVVRSERHNDNTVNGLTVLNTLNVDAGATAQTISSNQTRLTINTVNLGANSGIDSTNSTSVFIGNVAGGANTIRLTGSAQTRITGNVTAGQINVTGAGVDFDPGTGNTSTVAGPVALSGLLSVRSGSADLGNNVITGAATQVVAGLRENKTQGAFDETTANTSNEVKLGPVLANVTQNIGWGENQTATYTGQIFIPDNGTVGDGMGTVAFAKWFDDSIRVDIDGTTLLRNSSFNDGVANASGNLTEGWHDIEIRLGQGGGGAGPVGQDGNAFNLGLGIDITTPVSTDTAGGVGLVLNGSQYVAALDNGSMNLFRTTTVKSAINLAAGTTLTAGGFNNIGAVTLGGAGASLNLTAAVPSNADSLVVGTGSAGTLNVSQAAGAVTVGVLNLQDSLTKSGPGSLVVTGTGVGTGAVLLNAGNLVVNGSVAGNVTASGGTLSGSGSIGGTVDVTGGGTISPGSSPGVLTLNSLLADSSATLNFELARLGAGAPVAGTDYDQLKITGSTLDLGGTAGDANGAVLSLQLGNIAVGDIFTIILNQGSDTNAGTFAGLPNGATITQGAYQFQVSYFDDPLSPSFETSPGDGGTSVSLLTTVPEPGTATALVAAMSLLGLRRLRPKS